MSRDAEGAQLDFKMAACVKASLNDRVLSKFIENVMSFMKPNLISPLLTMLVGNQIELHSDNASDWLQTK